MEGVDWRANARQERLESELHGFKTNLIKVLVTCSICCVCVTFVACVTCHMCVRAGNILRGNH